MGLVVRGPMWARTQGVVGGRGLETVGYPIMFAMQY